MLVIHLLRQFSPVCFTLTAYDNLSVIRQKGESQIGGSKKARQIFRKNERFLHPDTHRSVFISGGKKCLFFGKFGELCFLVTSFLRLTILLFLSTNFAHQDGNTLSGMRGFHYTAITLIQVNATEPKLTPQRMK